MTTIFILIFILIVIGIFGGVLYLVYLPFKIKLLKSGKLTKRLNRQINWTYIGFLCLICILLFCFRNYRTPSKDRLEKISNIKLPSDFMVIKDEFHDMQQDYCLYYEIQFDKRASNELIKSIKASKYYNANAYHKEGWKDSDLILVGSVKAAWIKSPKGYDFLKPQGRTTYSMTLDTLTYKLSYNEGHD